MLTFSGLFLLKIASVFHSEVDLVTITGQVEQLAQLLSDAAAERSAPASGSVTRGADVLSSSYVHPLRIMLTHVRRKLGMVQDMLPPPVEGGSTTYADPQVAQDISLPLHENGLAYVDHFGTLKPSAIPLWLQEQVRRPSLLSGFPHLTFIASRYAEPYRPWPSGERI